MVAYLIPIEIVWQAKTCVKLISILNADPSLVWKKEKNMYMQALSIAALLLAWWWWRSSFEARRPRSAGFNVAPS